jgi:hypothetical protein
VAQPAALSATAAHRTAYLRSDCLINMLLSS